MTREEYLQILTLLSALEAAGLMQPRTLPDYLYDRISSAVDILTREILK